MPLNLRSLLSNSGITLDEVRAALPAIRQAIERTGVTAADVRALVPDLLELARDLGFGPDQLASLLPYVVEIIDAIVAVSPIGFLAKLAWKALRTFLLSRAGAEAVYGVLGAKGTLPGA